MTGTSLTSLSTGEIPPALSEGFPHPVIVIMLPTLGICPAEGRHDEEMMEFMGRGLGSSIRAKSLDRVCESH